MPTQATPIISCLRGMLQGTHPGYSQIKNKKMQGWKPKCHQARSELQQAVVHGPCFGQGINGPIQGLSELRQPLTSARLPLHQLCDPAPLCQADVAAFLRAQCGDAELVLGGCHLLLGRVEGLLVPLSIDLAGRQLIGRPLQHLGLCVLAIGPHSRERRGESVRICGRGCAGPSCLCGVGAGRSARICVGLGQQIDCLHGRTRGRGSLRKVAAQEGQVGGRRVTSCLVDHGEDHCNTSNIFTFILNAISTWISDIFSYINTFFVFFFHFVFILLFFFFFFYLFFSKLICIILSFI